MHSQSAPVTTVYNKLVRDRIPEILAAKGIETRVHIATDEEFRSCLLDKLLEEAIEAWRTPTPDELVDILEIVYTLGGLARIGPEELERLRQDKQIKRGGFGRRLILELTREID